MMSILQVALSDYETSLFVIPCSIFDILKGL